MTAVNVIRLPEQDYQCSVFNMPVFDKAQNTDASHGIFNDIRGHQLNITYFYGISIHFDSSDSTVDYRIGRQFGSGLSSASARVLASSVSGVAELLIFHPVDTVVKRLMSNRSKVSMSTVSPILFRDAASASLSRKLLSLFPGLGYAICYKIGQRVYKFSAQPYVNDVIVKHYATQFTNTFGERRGRMMMQATAGSLTGVGEVVLLPFDALKIKRQVKPKIFRGRSAMRIFFEEGATLYRGWGWTMARNAPGSFVLFGSSAMTKEYILGVADYSRATWTQNFIASMAGAAAAITVAAPLDTIKTRIQNKNFRHKVSGVVVIKDLVKVEGPTAFFKGLTPKLLVVGPKLVFSYTLAQSLIPLFSRSV